MVIVPKPDTAAGHSRLQKLSNETHAMRDINKNYYISRPVGYQGMPSTVLIVHEAY